MKNNTVPLDKNISLEGFQKLPKYKDVEIEILSCQFYLEDMSRKIVKWNKLFRI